jgi:hypothetical protein
MVALGSRPPTAFLAVKILPTDLDASHDDLLQSRLTERLIHFIHFTTHTRKTGSRGVPFGVRRRDGCEPFPDQVP